MNQRDWRPFNIAVWVEIILAYIMPFRKINEIEAQVGYPIPFISVYDSSLGVNPMMSMNLNPLKFLINVIIIYYIIISIIKVYNKFFVK